MKNFPLRFALAAMLAAMACGSALAADTRKKIVMLIAEAEYDTAKTLPEFAAAHLAKDFRVVTVTGSTAAGETAFDRIAEVADADILLVSVRRRTPPKAQFDIIRRHIQAGKPVVGIRTASHAFSLSKGQALATGNADWPQFDAEVIGGSYANHHPKSPPIVVTLASPTTSAHPILRGVTLPFQSESTLYKNTPLQPGATALINGTIPGQPTEPLAWTYTRPGGGRTFYTSLGSQVDFKNAAFVQLLRNGILWASQ